MCQKGGKKPCLIHTGANMPKTKSATKVVVWNVNVTHGMFGQRKSQM